MALPYHINLPATSGNIDTTRPLQYATALLLISLIPGLNLAAIIIRNRMQKKL